MSIRFNKKNVAIGIVAAVIVAIVVVGLARQASAQPANTIDRVLLTDAASRASLANHEDWTIAPSGYAEFQWSYSSFDDEDSAGHGFEMNRVGIGLQGQSKDDSTSFLINGAFVDETSFNLEDAWFRTGAFDLFDVRAGQFRPNVSFENQVGNGQLLTLDRSILNQTFASDYTQGVEGYFNTDYLGFSAFVVNGFSESTFDYTTNENEEYGFGARVVFALSGDLGTKTSYVQDEDNHIWLGASAYFDDDMTVLIADADAEWETFGVAAAAAFADMDGVSDNVWVTSVTPYFEATDTITAYGRYEYGDGDSDDTLNVASLGANVNLVGSAVRWTSEVGYTLDDLSGSWNTAESAWNGMFVEDGEFVFSSGFRLVF